MKPPASSSRKIHAGPPAAWNWFTSASPLGYTRASSGTTDESSSKSDQSIRNARAARNRHPVDQVVGGAARGQQGHHGVDDAALVHQLADGVKRLPRLPMSSTVRSAWRVKASRASVPGASNAAPGTCRPMASSSIWLLLAVP